MLFGFSGERFRNTVLGELIESLTPHPDTFVCGIRWPEGDEKGHGKRWRYRRVWVDPLRENGVVTAWFSATDGLRIRLDDDPWWKEGPSPRAAHAVLCGRSADTGASVLLAVPQRQTARFGVRVRAIDAGW